MRFAEKYPRSPLKLPGAGAPGWRTGYLLGAGGAPAGAGTWITTGGGT